MVTFESEVAARTIVACVGSDDRVHERRGAVRVAQATAASIIVDSAVHNCQSTGRTTIQPTAA